MIRYDTKWLPLSISLLVVTENHVFQTTVGVEELQCSSKYIMEGSTLFDSNILEKEIGIDYIEGIVIKVAINDSIGRVSTQWPTRGIEKTKQTLAECNRLHRFIQKEWSFTW